VSQTLDSSDEARAPSEPAGDLLIGLAPFSQSQHPRFDRAWRPAHCRPRTWETGPADDPVDVLRAAPDAVGDICDREALLAHGEDPSLDRSEVGAHVLAALSLVCRPYSNLRRAWLAGNMGDVARRFLGTQPASPSYDTRVSCAEVDTGLVEFRRAAACFSVASVVRSRPGPVSAQERSGVRNPRFDRRPDVLVSER